MSTPYVNHYSDSEVTPAGDHMDKCKNLEQPATAAASLFVPELTLGLSQGTQKREFIESTLKVSSEHQPSKIAFTSNLANHPTMASPNTFPLVKPQIKTRFSMLNVDSQVLMTTILRQIAINFGIADAIDCFPDDVMVRAYNTKVNKYDDGVREMHANNLGLDFIKHLLMISHFSNGDLGSFQTELRKKIDERDPGEPWVKLSDIVKIRNQVDPDNHSDSDASIRAYAAQLSTKKKRKAPASVSSLSASDDENEYDQDKEVSVSAKRSKQSSPSLRKPISAMAKKKSRRSLNDSPSRHHKSRGYDGNLKSSGDRKRRHSKAKPESGRDKFRSSLPTPSSSSHRLSTSASHSAAQQLKAAQLRMEVANAELAAIRARLEFEKASQGICQVVSEDEA